MSDLFLSEAELYDMTGYKWPSKQSEWLKRYGYPFTERADGHLRVVRSVIEGKKEEVQPEPNWEALEKKRA